MPFLRFDILHGWTDQQVTDLLDVTHSVVVDVFGVPKRDRYQVVQKHESTHVRMEDTGLGIVRSARQVFLQVTSRPRSQEQKVLFYRLYVERLEERCGISGDDAVINFIENTDEDWSFGKGEAQFLNGKLH